MLLYIPRPGMEELVLDLGKGQELLLSVLQQYSNRSKGLMGQRKEGREGRRQYKSPWHVYQITVSSGATGNTKDMT